MGGIGPGNGDYMIPRMTRAIESSEVILGYKKYISLLDRRLLTGKKIMAFSMRQEVKRAEYAVTQALSGKTVTVVSSGDPVIYGMAAPVLQKALESGIEVEIIPGITAAIAASSLMGSPLTLDFAVISLSDLLVPWEDIAKKLDALSKADMVTVIYNPASRKRIRQFEAALGIILKNLEDDTPVGIVKNAFREGQVIQITRLDRVHEYDIDMNTTVIVGNSKTRIINNRMINPRGYDI